MICKIIGHDNYYLQPSRGVASPSICNRCNVYQSGISWSRGIEWAKQNEEALMSRGKLKE